MVIHETETGFQDAVIELFRWCGWLVYHPFDSRKSEFGYPDLTMVKGGSLIFAELKVKGKPSKGKYIDDVWHPGQEDWLREFGKVEGRVMPVFWMPKDWDQIKRIAKGVSDG